MMVAMRVRNQLVTIIVPAVNQDIKKAQMKKFGNMPQTLFNTTIHSASGSSNFISSCRLFYEKIPFHLHRFWFLPAI
ncbi:MAG: hypothetical protein ABFC71_00295 [Methanoregula sp.]|jgi:5-methylcytosine-specific restriction endonuclease McrBC GTP-binding regulatory subunit McrB